MPFMLDIARTIRKGLCAVAANAGYELTLVRKGTAEPFIFDQVEFFTDGPVFKLYQNTLSQVGGADTDNVYKRLRFCILHQIVTRCAEKWPLLNTAECGCWRGHSTLFTATILAKHGFGGKMHVFDSFEGGLSEYQKEDKGAFSPRSNEEEQARRSHFASTEAEVRRNLADFPFVSFYKGWIPDRFDEVGDEKFSFVNIDVDMYQPTRDSLKNFMPRLVDGGAVFLDDYGYSAFPGAAKAVDEYFEQHPPSLFISLASGGAFAIK